MPYGYSPAGLFYNKAIFDEMEVEYPHDGMTWEELLEVAKRVAEPSRWHALDIGEYDLITSQLSLRLNHPDTRQVDFESDAWKRLEEFVTDIRSLQSMEQKHSSMTGFSNGRAAMMAGLIFSSESGLYNRAVQGGISDVEWEVARFPVFDDGLSLAPASHMLLIGVPRSGLNKNDSLITMRYLLSKKVQTINTRKGLISLRADMASEEFAEDLDFMTNKRKHAFIHPGPVGTFDPDMESLPIVSKRLELSFVRIPSIIPAEDAIPGVKEGILTDVRQYTDTRDRLIEEMKGKYGWE